jgi:hypothetical protein
MLTQYRRPLRGLVARGLTLLILCASVAMSGRLAEAQRVVYVCPMHPETRGAAGEKCRRCGMALVSTILSHDAYTMNVELTPRAFLAHRPGRVRFLVRHADDGAVVRRFELVHERVFHLFIVSQDLEYFQHVHPVLREDGSLDAPIEVPRAGVYRLIADFMPGSGWPQLMQKSIVTAGYEGTLAVTPILEPDRAAKTVENTRVTLDMTEATAGREQLVTFHLDEAGRGVEDLEPYLGAGGHLLVVSDDLSIAFHSHPVAALAAPAGPDVVFQVLFPNAGMYRLWAQFQRHGRVLTASFTVPVKGRS